MTKKRINQQKTILISVGIIAVAIVVSAYILFSSNISPPTNIVTSTSTTVATSSCGDKFCDSENEGCIGCPQDCGICNELIIQEASCTRSINPTAPPVKGEECGESCPRFTIQATIYNPNNYEVEVNYGYYGGFVDSYVDKRNTESFAKSNLGSINIPAKDSRQLSSVIFDMLYTGPDTQLSYVQIVYSTDTPDQYLGSDDMRTEPYALIC